MSNPSISRTFLYCPRSGDVALATAPCDEIAIIRWRNGCRHIIGGIRLSYSTAIPKFYWRSEACRLAEEIVRQTGGIAFDEQGTVSLVVRPTVAAEADRLMNSLAPDTGHALDRIANVARLVSSGYYTFADDGGTTSAQLDTVAWNYGRAPARLVWVEAEVLEPVQTGETQRHGVDLYYEGAAHPLTITAPWPVAECSVPRRITIADVTAQ